MTEKQKKIALAFGAVVVIVLALLWLRRGGSLFSQGGNVTQNLGGYNAGNITIDMPRVPFDLPAFALPSDQFSMISGCCSDCNSRSATTQSFLPAGYTGNTFVFNAADQGPTIYNYYQPPAVQAPAPSIGGTWYGYVSSRA